MNEEPSEISGKRIVSLIYLVAVVLSGGYGAIVATTVRQNQNVAVGTFGPITFSLSPVNLALYGVIMVGFSLGLFFSISAFAARYEGSLGLLVDKTGGTP